MAQDGNGHWFMSATIRGRIEMVVQKELIERRGASQKQIEKYFGIEAMTLRMTADFDSMFPQTVAGRVRRMVRRTALRIAAAA